MRMRVVIRTEFIKARNCPMLDELLGHDPTMSKFNFVHLYELFKFA